jgi:glycerol-3-phosphate acyltransferase PlsY
VFVLAYSLTALAAYLLGSVPTGFLAGKARGVDIRAAGSGNIGATNSFRILGWTAGTLVLLVDALKGFVSVWFVAPWIVRALAPAESVPQATEVARLVAAVCAVLGHNFTCWLKFKGGKGISTSAGVLLALVPGPLLVILAVFILLFASTRYVSVASMGASAALPIATWLCKYNTTLIVVTTGMAVMAIYKHKGNIRRLMDGTENRFGGKKKPTDSSNP